MESSLRRFSKVHMRGLGRAPYPLHRLMGLYPYSHSVIILAAIIQSLPIMEIAVRN